MGSSAHVYCSQKDEGLCPVINLKGINCYVNTSHFKMESISSVRDIIKENDFIGSLDMKSRRRKIKRNICVFGSKKRTTNSRPFHLEWHQPREFTKLLYPVIGQLQAKGSQACDISRQHPDLSPNHSLSQSTSGNAAVRAGVHNHHRKI